MWLDIIVGLVVICLVVLCVLVKKAPFGYQGDEMFHYGKPKGYGQVDNNNVISFGPVRK